MNIYKRKKCVVFMVTSLSALASITSFLLFDITKNYMCIVCGVVFLYATLSSLFMNLTIVINDKSITKKQFNKTKQEIRWEWIHYIKTLKSAGINTTVLHWAKEPQDRFTGGIEWLFRKNPKAGTFTVSEYYEGYNEIVGKILKYTQAECDPITDEIVKHNLAKPIKR